MQLTKPEKGSSLAAKRKRKREQKATESAAMKAARRRDRVCRFPICPCGQFKLRLEVAHQRHRGMGGNPKGDRTTTAGLVLLCVARHQGSLSVHSGDLRWVGLTKDGADGPIAWETMGVDGRWIELVREVRCGVTDRASVDKVGAELLERLRAKLVEQYS